MKKLIRFNINGRGITFFANVHNTVGGKVVAFPYKGKEAVFQFDSMVEEVDDSRQ